MLLYIKRFIVLAGLFLFLAYLGYLTEFAILEVDIEVDKENSMQIFWADENTEFDQEHSKITKLLEGRHKYRVKLNGFNKKTFIRFDPVSMPATVKVYGITWYSLSFKPKAVDLLTDGIHHKDLLVVGSDTADQRSLVLQANGEDPEIQFRVSQARSPIVFLLLLVLLIIIFCRRKEYMLATFFLYFFLLFYFLLGMNAAAVSFKASAVNPGQIKVFWRDVNETMTIARSSAIAVREGEHDYLIGIGNLHNVEVLYLEPAGGSKDIHISEVSPQEPGYVSHVYSETEIINAKDRDDFGLLKSLAWFIAVFALVFSAVLYALQYQTRYYRRFFPIIVRSALFLAAFQVFNLAWQADFNIHPDELAHIASVEYYSQYWDPPQVGEIRAEDAYQAPWAVSRLDDLGISYFLAGKFRNVVLELFEHEDFVARAFNCLLFLSLFVLSGNKRFLLFIVPLLCTPQIWYLFSYSNRGAFALFVSILLAWQLADKKSALNCFLLATSWQGSRRLVLYPGLLLGLLSIEQTNYLLFALFVCCMLLWEVLFIVQQKKQYVYRALLFFAVGLSVFGVRYAVDVHINGFNKAEQRLAYAEEHAGMGFKPSKAAEADSYAGLRLKEKGVKIWQLFNSDWQWHKMSYKSFVGFYGYYAEYSPRWYYAYVGLILIAVLAVLIWNGFVQVSWPWRLFSVLTFTALFGGVLMSLLLSWLYDFQPQGRYMFPVIPIALVYLWRMSVFWNMRQKALLITAALTLILLSFYSFNTVALNYLVS